MSEKQVTNPPNEQNEMKRGIRGWQVAFIGLGGVIGSCYFLGMGIVIHDMGPAVFIAFGIVGLIVYGLMIAYAELLVNVPRKGSFIAYTSEFLGPTISTGFGWAFWFNWVCYVPSEAIAVSTVVTALVNQSDNAVAYVAIAIGALAAITIINLSAVNVFAKIESGLAITKCIVIILFILMAFGIWVGLWGSDGFLGANVNFNTGAGFAHDLFPNGVGICITSMVVVLVTFQGTEIVGLTAAEAQDPDKSVPKACKSVTYRIVALYMVPILLVLLIYPYGLANDSNAVFSDIMYYYHMPALGKIFGAIVLVAAFSCANTGFYGTVRAMYGLSIEGLAPKFLGRLKKDGNPKNAVLFTLAFMWIILLVGLYTQVTGKMENLYANLLSMSGFTGTLAWIGIIASWMVFRKKFVKRGYNINNLRARVRPGQMWIPPFAMVAQIACLILMAFGEGMLPVFILACCAIFVPMIVRMIGLRSGHARDVNALETDEKTFDELYPPKDNQ
ncbi:MAG: amino acid permease [Eubacteriaceae bacterium]|nr:amino acid permease [Eubacteriaceae bacterium]